MAEERRESVILDFEVDEGASIESINSLTKANKALREERNKLNLQSADGQKRAKEINALLDQNTTKIKTNSSALEKQRFNIGNYTESIVKASQQIEDLKKKNEQLAVALRTVDKSTDEGKEQYNQFSTAIQNNITQINIYKDVVDKSTGSTDKAGESLKKLAPGATNAAQGFIGMAKAALAFIATPIGAVLAAIVVVFGLLKAALSQNDALMDKFENVTNAVGVVLEIVVARVGKLGEALIALAQGNFSEAINKTSQAFGGLADEIENAVRQQQLFLDASRELEDSQRNLRIETARQENEIRRLVVAAKNRNLTFDEQEGLLRKALELEENLVEQREDIARRDLLITARRLRSDKEFQQQSNETFDQYIERLLSSTALAPAELDKIADKVEALEQARGSSLAFQEKVENSLTAVQEKRALALVKQNEALAKQAELDAANRRAASKSPELSDVDPLQGAFDTQLNKEQELDITERFNKRIVDAEAKTDEEILRNKERSAQAQIETQRTIKDQTLQAASEIAGGIAGLLNEQGEAYKVAASAQVIISTYASAQKAYEAAFLPIPTVASPGLGVAFAAAAILKGIANLAAINGIQFWGGGYTGPGGKYDWAGNVHKGEVVWNQEDVKLAGGPMAANALRPTASNRNSISPHYFDGGLVARSSSQAIDQTFQLANIVKNLPPAVLDVREVTKKQRTIKVKEAISKR